MNRVAAVAVVLAGVLFLWLTENPGELGAFFGEDDADLPSGVVFLGLSLLGAFGIVAQSRLRWLGFGVIALGLLWWIPFVLNTDPAGPSPLFVLAYAVAAAPLLVSAVVRRRRHPSGRRSAV